MTIAILAAQVHWHDLGVGDRTSRISGWGVRAYLAAARPEDLVVLLPQPRPYFWDLPCRGYAEYQVTPQLRAWVYRDDPVALPDWDAVAHRSWASDLCAGYGQSDDDGDRSAKPVAADRLLARVQPAVLLPGGEVGLFPTVTLLQAPRLGCAGYREIDLSPELVGWAIDLDLPASGTCKAGL